MSSHRTDWFKDAGWGVFCHYLADTASNSQPIDLTPDGWNRRVAAFDVSGFADQIESARARYCFLTIGQNSGFFCAPNATYDGYVGITPSKCSERDLIADLSDELGRRGIPLLVYLPAGAPAADPIAVERLGWEWGYEGGWPHGHEVRTYNRLLDFQLKWESVIIEWSERWGSQVRGWWVDGCYFADEMYRDCDPPNFASFADAMRAGNPDSIVAFNPGVKYPIITLTQEEDYTAGEINECEQVQCEGRWVGGAQWHMLSYLGETWGRGEPRYTDAQAIGFTQDAMAQEGVVSWDVPIQHSGLIPEPFAAQLRALGKEIG
jgi:hypothetical protein